MAQTQIILLERVENLGQMGDVVAVKPGYARNFLLPQRKALRASKANLAYFEAQKKQLEASNVAKRGEAEKIAGKVKTLTVSVIRQAAEGGQLYGSVTTRDIAEAVTANGVTIERSQVRLNQAFKTIGLFPVEVALHPEVKITVTVNIARSEEEAKQQRESGKVMVTDARGNAVNAAPTKDALLDQEALAVEAQAEADAQAEAQANAEKSAKRAAKKASKKTDEAETAEDVPVENTEEA